MILGAALCAGLLVAVHGRLAVAEGKFIIVQSTTSTQNSGLFEHILAIFTKKPVSKCVSWRLAPARR
jgi:tungstate transport system substrate-binding protein